MRKKSKKLKVVIWILLVLLSIFPITQMILATLFWVAFGIGMLVLTVNFGIKFNFGPMLISVFFFYVFLRISPLFFGAIW